LFFFAVEEERGGGRERRDDKREERRDGREKSSRVFDVARFLFSSVFSRVRFSSSSFANLMKNKKSLS